jgi:hypothetical protein
MFVVCVPLETLSLHRHRQLSDWATEEEQISQQKQFEMDACQRGGFSEYDSNDEGDSLEQTRLTPFPSVENHASPEMRDVMSRATKIAENVFMQFYCFQG